MRLLIALAVALILPLAALLLGAGLTGRDHRAYRVLSPEDEVAVAGEVLPASLLAERYQPHLYLRPDTPSPALMWVWYEAVPGPEGISLVYYHAWEGETNPNPALQNLYALFRLAYYGYPLYDIEYFQVDVSRADGAVVGLRFEMGAADNYFALINEHVVVRLRRQPGGTFREERYTRRGRPLGQADGVAPLFGGQHVRVGVQTWNHLSKLLGPADSAYRERVTAALRPLSDDEYSRYKFVRKSQGDHRTRESPWTLPLATLATFVFMTLLGGVLYLLRRTAQAR